MTYYRIKNDFMLRRESNDYFILFNKKSLHYFGIFKIFKDKASVLSLCNGIREEDEIISELLIIFKKEYSYENFSSWVYQVFYEFFEKGVLEKNEYPLINNDFCITGPYVYNNHLDLKSAEDHDLCWPIKVSLCPSNKCFLYCKYCFADLKNLLSLEIKDVNLWISLFKNLWDGGCRFFDFSGTDPMMYDDIFVLLDYMSSFECNISISTKKILTKEEIDKLVSLGFNSFHRELQISFDTCDKNDLCYLYNNCDLSYSDKIKEMIEYAVHQNLNLVILGTVLKSNEDSILKTIKYLNKIGLKNFSYRRGHESFFRNIKNQLLNNEEFDELSNRIKSETGVQLIDVDISEKSYYPKKAHERICTGFFSQAIIYSDGSIYMCQAAPLLKEFCAGNVFESSFFDIWYGRRLEIRYPKRLNFKESQCFDCISFDNCVKYGICYVANSVFKNKLHQEDLFCDRT